MAIDTVLLSRIQFAFTIGFHILFPTLNIGLAVFLAIMETRWIRTRDQKYMTICRFWTKIFALTFGMGIVSGLVLSYELGTNFSGFTHAVGQVLGPLFSYEVMSAFFLEAGFLGVMLFGWKKVSPNIHYMATLLVAFGTVLSAFWILSANSWMQTPAGYYESAGVFIVDNWLDVIFNPSTVVRFLHMLMASMVTTSFVVAAVAGWYLLKGRHKSSGVTKTCFSFALMAALILVPVQIFLGDEVGLEVHKNQPIKTAAIEANWNTQQGAPLILFGIPDEKLEKNLYAITIPYGASLINTHQLDGTLEGLTSVPAADRPDVLPVFFTFRIMVGIGLLMLGVAIWAFVLRLRGKLYDSRALQRTLLYVAPLGFVATVTGWITAEMGRQPWIVYNVLRTADAASPVPLHQVVISSILLLLVYGIVFSFYLYYLFKLIRKGPVELDQIPPTTLPEVQNVEDYTK